jgi:hypothetical protein
MSRLRSGPCPEYDRAVLEIFGKADSPKAMVRHWNELIGYLVQPRRKIKGGEGTTAKISGGTSCP